MDLQNVITIVVGCVGFIAVAAGAYAKFIAPLTKTEGDDKWSKKVAEVAEDVQDKIDPQEPKE